MWILIGSLSLNSSLSESQQAKNKGCRGRPSEIYRACKRSESGYSRV